MAVDRRRGGRFAGGIGVGGVLVVVGVVVALFLERAARDRHRLGRFDRLRGFASGKWY